MNQSDSLTAPKWYWTVAGVALVWNLLGCLAFLTELFAQETMMKEWTEEQKQWAKDIPTWIYFFYGIAVATGVAGSAFLLMRKSWAIAAFAISTVAIIIQMGYTMIVAGGLQIMGPTAAIMPCLVTTLSFVFLWFSFFAKGKGWMASSQDS